MEAVWGTWEKRDGNMLPRSPPGSWQCGKPEITTPSHTSHFKNAIYSSTTLPVLTSNASSAAMLNPLLNPFAPCPRPLPSSTSHTVSDHPPTQRPPWSLSHCQAQLAAPRPNLLGANPKIPWGPLEVTSICISQLCKIPVQTEPLSRARVWSCHAQCRRGCAGTIQAAMSILNRTQPMPQVRPERFLALRRQPYWHYRKVVRVLQMMDVPYPSLWRFIVTRLVGGAIQDALGGAEVHTSCMPYRTIPHHYT